MHSNWTRWTRKSSAVASAALAFNGCADATTNPGVAQSAMVQNAMLQDRIAQMRDRHGAIGRYHNDGLAFVLERLQKSKARYLDFSSRCNLAEKAAREFHVSVRRLKLPPGTPAESMISSICVKASAPGVKRTVVTEERRGSRRRSDLSPAANGYIDQIETLLSTAQGIDQLRTAANRIESDAISSLDDTEAGEIAQVISVLNSSADYWQANYSAWESQTGSGQPLAYSVDRSFSTLRSSIQVVPVRGPRHGVSFRDYLRFVRADVWGAIMSPYGYTSFCTVLACRGFDAFVASMREAIALQ
ncbi:MAG: hypothetical protein H0U13_14675 [Gemmatimonadaceae bacterium]|nr:hypothetical protein [Gemmatimonadaceae bacterium]